MKLHRSGGTSPAPSTTVPSGEVVQVVLPGIVEPEGLQVTRVPRPLLRPGQVRIAVEASGISFAEQQMRRGKYYDQPAFPFVPGYDLVGTVIEARPGAGRHSRPLLGRRVAAVTKTGGWASEAVLAAADVIEVPAGLDAADAETVVVNGVTAWQLLHRSAKVQPGQTILVLGANGGVGSTLVQLARHAGVRVIGTASDRHLASVTALGAEAVDRSGPDMPLRVRELAPDGVDAVFDHVGGPGIVDSFRLLRRGGTLVSYGTASTRDAPGNARLPVLLLLTRLTWWDLLPNGRRTRFYNLWAGARRPNTFRPRLRADLHQVLSLLASGTLQPQVAARIPLSEAAGAMRLAESGMVTGKVVLVPDGGDRAVTRTSP